MNFFYYFTQWLLNCLIIYVHMFFYLHLRIFGPILDQESLKALGALKLLSLEGEFIF